MIVCLRDDLESSRRGGDDVDNETHEEALEAKNAAEASDEAGKVRVRVLASLELWCAPSMERMRLPCSTRRP